MIEMFVVACVMQLFLCDVMVGCVVCDGYASKRVWLLNFKMGKLTDGKGPNSKNAFNFVQLLG